MADLAGNIRLAVDSGEVALGIKEVSNSIKLNKAQLVVAAKKGKADLLQDIEHVSKVASIKFRLFEGDSMDLGRLCGKPYSVSVLSVINPGNSKILESKESE